MTRSMVLAILLALFCFSGALHLFAQEKSSITVRGSELSNGVVILDAVKGDRSFTLECNQGAPDCTALSNGKYLMIELPKNFGMYECKDVEVYPESANMPGAAMPDKHKKVGEYCLTDK